MRSALKTIAVTQAVWGEHLAELGVAEAEADAEEAAAPEVSATGEAAVDASGRLVPIQDIYTPAVQETLNALQQDEEWIVHRESVEAKKSLGDGDRATGLFLKTRCTADEHVVSVDWQVDATGKIARVTPAEDWPSPDVEEAFTGLETLSLEEVSDCSTAGELAAAEVLAIAKAHLGE